MKIILLIVYLSESFRLFEVMRVSLMREDSHKSVVLKLFWPMDYLLKKISDGPLCNANI